MAPPDASAVAVHVLGSGVGHDVGAPLEGPAASTGVGKVLSTMSGTPWPWAAAAKRFDVEHGQRRVCDGLAEDYTSCWAGKRL